MSNARFPESATGGCLPAQWNGLFIVISPEPTVEALVHTTASWSWFDNFYPGTAIFWMMIHLGCKWWSKNQRVRCKFFRKVLGSGTDWYHGNQHDTNGFWISRDHVCDQPSGFSKTGGSSRKQAKRGWDLKTWRTGKRILYLPDRGKNIPNRVKSAERKAKSLLDLLGPHGWKRNGTFSMIRGPGPAHFQKFCFFRRIVLTIHLEMNIAHDYATSKGVWTRSPRKIIRQRVPSKFFKWSEQCGKQRTSLMLSCRVAPGHTLFVCRAASRSCPIPHRCHFSYWTASCLEIDEGNSVRWRYRRWTSVHRMSRRTRVGTGGSSGEDCLKAAARQALLSTEGNCTAQPSFWSNGENCQYCPPRVEEKLGVC